MMMQLNTTSLLKLILPVYNKRSGIIHYIFLLILCQNELYYIYSNRDILYSKHSRRLLCTCFVLDICDCVHTRKRNINTTLFAPTIYNLLKQEKYFACDSSSDTSARLNRVVQMCQIQRRIYFEKKKNPLQLDDRSRLFDTRLTSSTLNFAIT